MNRQIISIAALIAIFAASGAVAEVERLQPDFTFKRVTVPTGNTTNRITVQIDPTAPRLGPVYAEPEPEPIVAGGAIVLPQPSGLEWFWTTVSPAMDDPSPVRLQRAMEQINNPPRGSAIAAPRLQALQDIASEHGLHILRETVGTRVSPALVLAVIAVESAGRTQAVSSAGAEGLMQLMPDTATRFGVTNSMDPAENIKGGVAYLAWLLDHFGNDPLLALAGYNAGEGNVRRYDGVPPFSETRAYVPKVLAAWQVAKGLCRTPPELITDACVFNVNGI
ncbi:MAG: lytic transglycosylase domain-containing protein [Yoonia sp.]|uniref:lytic transglycosylase domain-containing protein n=1 Tax=Yoonia sp. TaxID=2212373 RepID=UPI00273F10C7|nr:lytic transglycosylase domain-containing protein [Yoonia sp.]MDP5085817.1 lytic transglycosylase domain-containing protein [Yoonia sp.]MDP5362250.1 lytic transglycosylase domain-containing protein [Paracoccaceae bacterium]